MAIWTVQEQIWGQWTCYLHAAIHGTNDQCTVLASERGMQVTTGAACSREIVGFEPRSGGELWKRWARILVWETVASYH